MTYKRICEKLAKVLQEDGQGKSTNQEIMNKYRDLAQDAWFLIAADEMLDENKTVLKKLADS